MDGVKKYIPNMHDFDVNIACLYGVNEALVLDCIYDDVVTNTAIRKNYVEGKYWTSKPISAFAKEFPYMSEKTIKRVLNHLVAEKLILKSRFAPLNGANYYTITERAENLLYGKELI